MQEACWRSICAKNEQQYKDLMLNLEKKDKALRDLEQSSIFSELQYIAMGE